MLTLSSSSVSRFKALKIISIMFAVWVLGTGAFSAARGENATVRLIGSLDSVIAPALLSQVNIGPFTLQHDSSILLQGKTMSQLQDSHKQELREDVSGRLSHRAA
jgi:hypothetical protein